MRKKTLFFVSVVTAALLTGCGGGGSSSNSSSAVSSITGKVADGYLVGATVFLDKNDNGTLDAGEPNAITKQGGVYTISANSADAAKYPLIVDVPATAIDEDTNTTVGSHYTLSAPKGEKFISPISTLVQNYVENNSNATVDTAKKAIAAQLGIDVNATHLDYVENKNKNVHEKAKIIAKLKAELTEASANKNISEDIAGKKAFNKYLNDKIAKKLSDIKNGVDLNNLDADVVSKNINDAISLDDGYFVLTKIQEDKNAEKAKKLLGDGDIIDLKTSQYISQNTKYSKTYNGGTDFKTFTIKNTNYSTCHLYFLDTTSSSNPYINDGEGWSLAGYTNKTDGPVLLSSSDEDVSFTLTWMYYTVIGSHVDFYVNCEKNKMYVPAAK